MVDPAGDVYVADNNNHTIREGLPNLGPPAIVGEPHVLTGDATAGFAVDWTGRFQGLTPAVVRPGDTAEVAAVLALCTDARVPVVPQDIPGA